MEVILTDKAPKPVGPYSQGIKAGPWLFVSGQLPIDPGTGGLVNGDIRAQTLMALRNVKSIVEASGGEIDDIVKVSAYLVNMDDFKQFNEAYDEFFRGRKLPARTTVIVKELPRGALIELDAIACIK